MEDDFYKVLQNLDFVVSHKAGYYEAKCRQYPSIRFVTEDAEKSLELVKREVYNLIKSRG